MLFLLFCRILTVNSPLASLAFSPACTSTSLPNLFCGAEGRSTLCSCKGTGGARDSGVEVEADLRASLAAIRRCFADLAIETILVEDHEKMGETAHRTYPLPLSPLPPPCLQIFPHPKAPRASSDTPRPLSRPGVACSYRTPTLSTMYRL